MRKTPLWKPALILAAIALSFLCLYTKPLKLGLDLAGGTTLVYQVNIPPGADAQRDIEDTISVLRNRVDPTGVRNLVWIPQVPSHRIEIQMAVASKTTNELQTKYIQAREGLFIRNIAALQLDAALRATPDQREALFEQFASGNPSRLELLKSLGAAYDAMELARAPYEKAQQQLRDADAALAKITSTTQPNQAAQDKRDAIQTDLTARTRVFLAARKKYDDLRLKVMATNVEVAEFERVVAASKKPTVDDKGNTVIPRTAAVEQLIKSHPNRASQINEVAAAYSAYEDVKGPLDDPNDLIQLLRGSGVLEFRIAPSPRDVPDLAQYREQLKTRGPRGITDKRYKWLPIDDITRFAEEVEQQAALKANPEAYFAQTRDMIAQKYGDDIMLLLANTPEASLTHATPRWQLTDARNTGDQNGFPAVAFELNEIGGNFMGELTGGNLHKPMAIVLDDKVVSAPTIQGRISSSGQISGGRGGFSGPEQDYLVRTLKAGSLRARISESPISIQTTGATFGLENLHASVRAATWSLILVAAFMLVYYYMLGTVAGIAMVLNILLVLAVMAAMEATFTLSGIAGIVLTIGMAVDSNVLIYERIREELERGIELRRAIQLGFERAFRTIIDAHVTTILTCWILYGCPPMNFLDTSSDVKGFAVTLGIGLLANLFTAVFCSRVFIETYVQIFKPHTIKMLAISVPAVHRIFTPNIDWVGKRHIYIGISGVLTIGGMIGICLRGSDFLDIEFRSGTQVSFELGKDAQGNQKTLSVEDVRKRLSVVAASNDKVKLLERATPVTLGKVENDKAGAFTIQTLVTDPAAVSDAIKTAFADVLESKGPISFSGMGDGKNAPDVKQAPIFAIRDATLGVNIRRQDVRENVAPYLGGVAVVIEDMTPAATLEDIKGRITRIGSQPDFESLGYRSFQVIGLDLAETPAGATTQPASAEGAALYRSVVIVAHDEHTNYAEAPETLTDTTGSSLAETEWKIVREALRRDTSLAGVTNFSSQVSKSMQQQAIVAIVLSWLAITGYIWLRFGSLAYGIGAVLALIHDVITAVGLAAWAFYLYDTPVGHALLLAPFRIDLTMIAAVLTLIGYSVNDTIVIFDRIRENRGKLAYASSQVINDSINQTISRTVLTVVTVLVAVLALYILGGPGVHNFAFVMLVGALVGCYSSIAVAAPLLLLIKHTPEQEKKRTVGQ